MKKLWNFLIGLAESMARARAATALSRQGKHEEARRLLAGK